MRMCPKDADRMATSADPGQSDLDLYLLFVKACWS